jgi:hypothetical protein
LRHFQLTLFLKLVTQLIYKVCANSKLQTLEDSRV